MDGIMKQGTLGSILMQSNIITETDIQAALVEQRSSGCRFGEALVKLGVVTQEDIDWALSNQLDIPYVRLKKDMIDSDAVQLVPAMLARKHNLIPLIRAGDELSIALADPLNLSAISEVEHTTGCRVAVSVALIRELREMQDHFYGPAEDAASLGFTSEYFPAGALAIINADTSGSKLLDYLLAYMVQNRLASLSLQPMGDVVRVTGRRGGKSRGIGQLAPIFFPDLLSRIKKLSKIGSSPDCVVRGVLELRIRDRSLQFQTLMLRGLAGDYVTFKLHVTTQFPSTLEDLCLPADKGKAFASLTSGTGMVLFALRDSYERCRLMDLFLEQCETAGKTVLLIGECLGRGRSKYPSLPLHAVSQDQVHALILATLEHDPDILVIEDITDSQPFIAAAKAAMRGKLVLAGLSIHDTANVFKHLLYFRHKHYFIPAYVKGVVAGKGVLTLCPHCKEIHHPSVSENAVLAPDLAESVLYRARGCGECDQSGYRGRRHLLDVIPFEPGVIEAFEAARDGRDVLHFLTGQGYRGISEQGIELLNRGEISLEEFETSILL